MPAHRHGGKEAFGRRSAQGRRPTGENDKEGIMTDPIERGGGRETLFEMLELCAQNELHKSDLDPDFDSVADLEQKHSTGAPYYTMPFKRK